MKIGILKETKIPVDNRVALTPTQIKQLSILYPEIKFKVQSSNIRAYSDDEYRTVGIKVSEDISDCDFFLGIKEAAIDTLLPRKHYVFFGHIAKMQPYNKDLFKRLIDLKTTFSDYEYLTNDQGLRLVAFGWYAGVVGLYYTLMGWGIKTQTYTLPIPHMHFSVNDVISTLKNASIPPTKLVVTGNGRVSQGAQYILENIGARRVDKAKYVSEEPTEGIIYCVLKTPDLVAPNDSSKSYDPVDFKSCPEKYHSIFHGYQNCTDVLVSCHFWANNQPIYLTRLAFMTPGFRIKMIGDITCDIKGSIQSTLRPSTHSSPFYDYNPFTVQEETAFTNDKNITVMAVDTCPNALPRETSKYFGEQLTQHVLTDLFTTKSPEGLKVLERATIIKEGDLTTYFDYLKSYVSTL